MRKLLALVALAIALAAAAMLWGRATGAVAEAAGVLGVMEECGRAGGCSAQVANHSVWSTADEWESGALPRALEHMEASQAVTQQGDIGTREIPIWSSMMTVGQSDIASVEYLGFITGDWPDTGTIDDVTFSYGGVDYIVTALYHPIVTGNPNHLFLHLDKPLPTDLRLRAGTDSFAVSDALILGPKHNINHWYLDSRLDWVKGASVTVALMARSDSSGVEEWLVRRTED